MKPVLIEEHAEYELTASIEFYEGRQIGLGQEFRRAAEVAVRQIQREPERYPIRADETRRHAMRRFPFIIHYLDLSDCIWIVAFAHTSRKPGYWKLRLRSRPG